MVLNGFLQAVLICRLVNDELFAIAVHAEFVKFRLLLQGALK